MSGTLTKTELLDFTKEHLPEQGNCWSQRSGAVRAAGLVVAPNATHPTYQVDIAAEVVNLAGEDLFGAASGVSLTVDMSQVGANGHEQTANLTGTLSTSGTAVTGSGTAFLTDFVAGDVVNLSSGSESGEGARVASVASNTAMTLEAAFSSDQSGESFRRGGEAPSTWYGVYVIADSSGVLPVASLLSTREAGPALPDGYDLAARVGSVRNDGSSDLLGFFQQGAVTFWDEMQQVFSATADAGFTNRSPLVPAWAPRAQLELRAETDGSATAAVSTLARRDGSSATNGCLRVLTAAVEDQILRVTGWVPLVSGVVEVKSAFPAGASGTSSAHTLGYAEPFVAG